MIGKVDYNFSEYSDEKLILLYGDLVSELRSRKIIRSKNIVGDLGEHLVINVYNNTPGLPKLQEAPVGTQNIDAISRQGQRYAIKTTTGRTTGVFYGLPSQGSIEEFDVKFDFVIIVQLNKNYEALGIYELSWLQFLKFKRWHTTVRAWNLSLTRMLKAESKKIWVKSPNTLNEIS